MCREQERDGSPRTHDPRADIDHDLLAMTTLVLSPVPSPDSRRLGIAAERRGWSCARLTDWVVPGRLDPGRVVISGELKLGQLMSNGTSVALLGPPAGWLSGIPEDLRKRPVRVTTAGCVSLAAGPRFVKPTLGKTLPSRVYSQDEWVTAIGFLGVPDDLAVEVSEPVEWEVEYRCFVRNRSLATMAPYFRRGRSVASMEGVWPANGPESPAAREFAVSVLDRVDVDLPPGVVLDVGWIKHRGWAITEANDAWSSGIYGCDESLVLDVLRAACRPASALGPDDQRWVRVLPPIR